MGVKVYVLTEILEQSSASLSGDPSSRASLSADLLSSETLVLSAVKAHGLTEILGQSPASLSKDPLSLASLLADALSSATLELSADAVRFSGCSSATAWRQSESYACSVNVQHYGIP